MSEEFPKQENPDSRLEAMRKIVNDNVAIVRAHLVEQESEAIENLLSERGPSLPEEEKKLLSDALYSRVKAEREKFFVDITEEFLMKTDALTTQELIDTLSKKKDEYEEKLIRLIVLIYSEFHKAE